MARIRMPALLMALLLLAAAPALPTRAVPPAPSVQSSAEQAAPVIETPPDAVRARFGVGVVDGDPRQVTALGLEWFSMLHDADYVPPPGTKMPRFLPVTPPLDEERARELARRFPGSHWLVGNEPNVAEATVTLGNSSPENYARALERYARTIKDSDPTAKLVGPNVLNWTFLCIGCPGYALGIDWTTRMWASYVEQFGAPPPLDVWAIHTYDLDWVNFPNGNAERHIQQMLDLREWLDAEPASFGRPIWNTEAGIHWGYPALEWRGEVAHPVGEYSWDHVEGFMRGLFGWLNANADTLSIERWFIYPISTGIHEPFMSTYGGITLMDGPGVDAPVNRLGRVYQELAGVAAAREPRDGR